MSDVSVVLITAPNADEARALARALVAEGLAACVNLVPQITSIYRWEGALVEESEVLLIAKTTAAALPALIERVRALHTYDVPEVIALPLAGGSQPYLDWVVKSIEDEGVA